MWGGWLNGWESLSVGARWEPGRELVYRGFMCRIRLWSPVGSHGGREGPFTGNSER